MTVPPIGPDLLIVWMDEIVFSVLENSKLINKTIYIAIGLRKDGFKEVLSMWLSKYESTAYWMTVLPDMKAGGMEDILITAADNLNGFTKRSGLYSLNQLRESAFFIRSAIAASIWSGETNDSITIDMKDIYSAPTR